MYKKPPISEAKKLIKKGLLNMGKYGIWINQLKRLQRV